jgi:hypothetical protein
LGGVVGKLGGGFVGSMKRHVHVIVHHFEVGSP